MQKIKRISVIEYRNGIYQGEVEEQKPKWRNGMGILITDQEQILLGKWKNDKLNGNALVWLNSNEYALAEFNRGEFQGYSIFRNKGKVLFAELNSSKPISKLLLIDHVQSKVKKIGRQGPKYQVEDEYPIQNMNESQLIEHYLRIKFDCPSLTDFIEQQFCKQGPLKLQVLPNGSTMAIFDDQTNPRSLGFVFGLQETIISYGIYIAGKLNGMGAKFQNQMRHQGQFVNGLLNGFGMKESNNHNYSFGQFQNGNLVDVLELQEGSDEQKLKQLKKNEHIKSAYFYNGFISRKILNFQGIKEVNYETNMQAFYLHAKTHNQGNRKNVQNVAKSNFLKNMDFDTKSKQSIRSMRRKNPQDDESINDSLVRNQSSLGILNKFKLGI